MNNIIQCKKAFTLIELLAVIVILAIILVIAIPQVLNVIEDVRTNAYISNEKMLLSATKLYTLTNSSSLPTNIGETQSVNMIVLKKQGFISAIKDFKDKTECDGSVSIKKVSEDSYEYTPYLSCNSNYESEQYITSGLVANYKMNGDAIDSTKLSSNGVVNGALPVKDRKSFNILHNGNFSFDINNDGKADKWGFQNVTNVSLNNNIQYMTPTTAGGKVWYTVSNIIGHIYYYSIDVKTDSSVVNLNNGYVRIPHSGSGNFEKLSWRSISTAVSTPHLTLYDDRASVWTEIQVKNAQYYDLTAIFGAGNEPTKQWCDSNLVANNYKAYGFDGIDDYIQIPDSTNLRMSSGGTISAWIYPLSAGENTYGRIVDKSTGVSGNDGYFLSITPSNGIYLQISGATTTISNSNAVTLNSWNYVTATISSTGKKIYVNGVDITSVAGDVSALPVNVAGNVTIGNRTGSTDRTFDGYIDDVRFYNRVLTQTEIINNYNIEK